MEYSICGYDCKNCPLYQATLSKDNEKIKKIMKKMDCNEVTKYYCNGCKSELISNCCLSCFIKKCAEIQNIDSCGHCEKYPCEYIKEHLSKESLEVLNKMNMEYKHINKKRVAVIGMSGNSLFYESRNGKNELVHEEVGGKGYNQAIALIRNGVKVSYLTAVGTDKNAIILESFMKKEGIDTFFIHKNKPTLEAKIIVDEQGNNTVLYDRENVSELDKEDLAYFEEEIKRSDALLLQYEYKKEVIEQAIALAKKYQKLIVVNPAPMIYNDINLVKDASIITPNELEARTLFQIDGKKSFEQVVEKEQNSPINKVINTVGEQGIIAVLDKNVLHYPSIKVHAIDTTGAGDTFNGVFLATLLKTNNYEEAIKRGIIASGIEVTKNYVMDAIPNEIEIDEYIMNSKE